MELMAAIVGLRALNRRCKVKLTSDSEYLVESVNRLAEDRERALRGAEEQAAATRRDVESERNRLAALMSQLTVAVVVCNSEGRILL